jgi:hypothetical protein
MLIATTNLLMPAGFMGFVSESCGDAEHTATACVSVTARVCSCFLFPAGCMAGQPVSSSFNPIF